MMDLIEASIDAPPLLFLGEGARNGYVEGALSTAFRLTKVNSGQVLAGSDVEPLLGDHALIVLSDYPAGHLTAEHSARIVNAVERTGRGLLMIGGWGSFGGPAGSYYGSSIAELLPVEVDATDDRVNSPLGTVLVARREPHPAIESIQGQEPCVVVGYNGVRAKPDADVLVEAEVAERGHCEGSSRSLPWVSRPCRARWASATSESP